MSDVLSTLRLYRLVKERFVNTPLSTEGARLYSGRWHPAGRGILYTSATPELTLLEQLVHLPTLPYEDLPRLFLLTLSVPDNRRIIPTDELPTDWRDEANFSQNHQFLAPWLSAPDVLAVGVPSAVVSESLNYLLHPAHPLFAQIAVESAKPFPIDPRLWRKS
jgi:RES domain-containing protein